MIAEEDGRQSSLIKLLSEIPIRFQSTSVSSPRFRVHVAGKSLHLLNDSVLNSSSLTLSDPPPPVYHTLDDEHWKAQALGCASARRFFLDRQKLLITTQALVEEPHVICVSVLKLETASNTSRWEDSQCSSSVLIDLGSLLTFLENNPEYPMQMQHSHQQTSFHPFISNQRTRRIVKSACFRREELDASTLVSKHVLWWDLVLVDNKGSILTIQLKYDDDSVQLTPVEDAPNSSIRFITMNASQYAFSSTSKKQNIHRTKHSNTLQDISLVTSQVDFLDSRRILLAVSPHPLCVDTVTGAVASWSENHCIQGQINSYTTLNFRMPPCADSSASSRPTIVTLACGSANMGSTRKKKHSLSHIFKNASGLLQGKSVIDMFMEEQEELMKQRRNYRDYHRDAFLDLDEDLDVNMTAVQQNTSTYDALFDLEDDEFTMAATSAISVLRFEPAFDPNVDIFDCDNGPVKAVFTLHADGTIRMWIMPDLDRIGENLTYNIFPWAVKVLYDSNFIMHESQNIPLLPIPPPHTWSSASDSVSLSCTLWTASPDICRDTSSDNLLGSILKTPKKRSLPDAQENDPNHGVLQYALTVSIRTVTVDSTIADTVDRQDTYRRSSPCHLTLFRGLVLDTPEEQNSAGTSVEVLLVPDEAKSVNVMSFDASSLASLRKEEWSLKVLYNCLEVMDVSGSNPISHPSFGLLSSVKSPCILASYTAGSVYSPHLATGRTLDDIAYAERENFLMQSSALRDTGIIDYLMQEQEMNCSADEGDIDRTVKCIESWYMKRLFRSSWGRSIGNGLVSEGSIRRALLHVFPNRTDNSPMNEYRKHSVEIDTLSTMREWANHQEAKYWLDMTRRKRNNEAEPYALSIIPDSSFYKAITPRSITPRGDFGIDSEFNQDVVEPTHKSPGERRRIIFGHHSRWVKFLLATWNEEAKLRTPVVFTPSPCPEESDEFIILRAASTACIKTAPETLLESSDSNFESLNHLSLHVLENVSEGGYDTRLKIASLEMKVQDATAKAALVLSDTDNILEELLVDISSIGEELSDPSQYSTINDSLCLLSDDDVKLWLFSIPSCLSSGSEYHRDSQQFLTTGVDCDNDEIHRSSLSCSSVITANIVDEIHKLSLARCILIAYRVRFSGLNPELGYAALRVYLTMTALKWSYNQKSSLPNRQSNQLTHHAHSSDLVDKARGYNTGAAIVNMAGSCTVLDAALNHFFKSSALTTKSYQNYIMQLSSKFISICEITSSLETNLNLTLTLPLSLTDRSRYVLRLVAPIVSYPVKFSLKERQRYRDLAASSLLNEMDHCVYIPSLHGQLILLHSRASLFLQRRLMTDGSNENVHLVLEALNGGPSQPRSSRIIGGTVLTELLNSIFVKFLDENLQTEALILSKMQSIRSLLEPWIHASIDSDTRPLDYILQSLDQFGFDALSIFSILIAKMSLVARSMYRVEVLEGHSLVDRFGEVNVYTDKCTENILSAIADSILVIEESFPKSFYQSHMVEYSSLWSKAFYHAKVGRLWATSFKAAMSNPIHEKKISEFRELVLTMADSGEFDILLELIPVPVINSNLSQSDSFSNQLIEFNESHAIDLYELVSDTLVAAASEISFDSVATSNSSAHSRSNYSGCLYALHSSQENWRRCAQTMDYSGLIIMNTLCDRENNKPSGERLLKTTAHDQKIIEDLTLSCVAASQLMQLLSNPSERFIDRSEMGPWPVPSSLHQAYSSAQMIDKSAGHSSHEEENNLPVKQFTKVDELSLSLQACKMMAIRRISLDSLSKFTALELLFTRPIDVMFYLAQLGYHADYLGMAATRKKSNNGTRPRGRELLADAVTYIIHDYLAPIAVRSAYISNEDQTAKQVSSSLISSRPSIDQLRQSSSGTISIPDLWRSSWQIVEMVRADNAMELIRSYTERYSNVDNALAIEVAHTLLELDMGQAALPSWLTSILLGPPKDRGLFAGFGDPSSLVLAYIRWNMLLEASNVVITTLYGSGFDRKRSVTSRLPEKGNIDFVPYKVIDLLWDLMEKEMTDLSIDDAMKEHLHQTRIRLERALVYHFDLMKICEAGIHSARVLKPS